MGRLFRNAVSTVVGAAFCYPSFVLAAADPRAVLACPPARQSVARVIGRLPHDASAFTQGLLWDDGQFVESVGGYGRSEIRRTDPDTGRIAIRRTLPPDVFAEGVARVGGELVQLSWTNGRARRLDPVTLRLRGYLRYPGEGWGLSDHGDGFVRSDGTATLTFHDATSFAETRRVAVSMGGAPLTDLNELETIDGAIWANVWHSDFIVAIDPATGCVRRRMDLSAIVAEIAPTDPEAVANGIAWDAANRRLFVTGKLWPTIFEIAAP